MVHPPRINGKLPGLNYCACGCGQILVVKFPGEYAVGHNPRRDRYWLSVVVFSAATALILATCYGIATIKQKVKTWVIEQQRKNP